MYATDNLRGNAIVIKVCEFRKQCIFPVNAVELYPLCTNSFSCLYNKITPRPPSNSHVSLYKVCARCC